MYEWGVSCSVMYECVCMCMNVSDVIRSHPINIYDPTPSLPLAYTTDKLKGLSSSGSDSDESGSCTSLAKRPRGKGKGKGASNERSPGQRSPGQGAESTGSDMEFDSLAREIILREQACVTGAGQCVTEEPCLLQGINAGGKKGWGRRRHWSGK